MLLFHQVALSLTTCSQIVELQDDNKLLEQLVTTTCNKSVELNNLVASCQQAGNKQCEHILSTSCWNSIATSLLQVCGKCVPVFPSLCMFFQLQSGHMQTHMHCNLHMQHPVPLYQDLEIPVIIIDKMLY